MDSLFQVLTLSISSSCNKQFPFVFFDASSEANCGQIDSIFNIHESSATLSLWSSWKAVIENLEIDRQ